MRLTTLQHSGNRDIIKENPDKKLKQYLAHTHTLLHVCIF